MTRAKPLFEGHYQPHVPGELGVYDLRDAAVREAQARMAGSYGIEAFCYYHYWFAGHRLLERPFDEVLASGRPDFPFCLCWANEPWTRTWDGSRKSILMDQTYSEDDDRRHIDWLLDAFRDPRYVRVEGKPLFLVYRAEALPNARRTMAAWRESASRAGLPGLYLCRVESHRERGDPTKLGFDAAVEFQPAARDLRVPPFHTVPRRALRRMGVMGPTSSQILRYDDFIRQVVGRDQPPYLRFPCVTPQWDNTPRRPHAAFVLDDSSPDLFGGWVAAVADRLRSFPPEQRLLFVNAWNEWGEGCHLEPCDRWGHGYLEAYAKATAG